MIVITSYSIHYTKLYDNKRTINQFIHPLVMESCQLVLGYTTLEDGSVWNTMPAHVHDRRMEAYLYWNMDEKSRVLHLMGEPHVITSYSIHYTKLYDLHHEPLFAAVLADHLARSSYNFV